MVLNKIPFRQAQAPGAPPPAGRHAGTVAPAWQLLLWACLAWIFLLARLWPTRPLFPGDGLDYSWQFAMDFATAHKMAIGRDVVFTYGPYADLASRLYNPATRTLNMLAMALLAASLAVPLAALARPAALLCTLAMLPLAYSNDAFALVLPLPALLLCASTGKGHETTMACMCWRLQWGTV